MSPDEKHDSVDNAFVSRSGSHIVINISLDSAQRSRSTHYLAIKTSDLTAVDTTRKAQLQAREMPSKTAMHIAKVPGFVCQSPRRISYGMLDEVHSEAEDVFVFLDHDNWVRSFNFGDDMFLNSKIGRHFFLPQDWVNTGSLRLATVSKDGKIYCPRNGEVAVVSNWLQNERVD